MCLVLKCSLLLNRNSILAEKQKIPQCDLELLLEVSENIVFFVKHLISCTEYHFDITFLKDDC